MLAGEATLLRLLEPFAAALARPGTREIVVNRPGRFGVEGEDGWSWHDAPELTFARLDAILTLAASRTSKRVGPDRPSASSVLPGGERIMGARPPAAPPATGLVLPQRLGSRQGCSRNSGWST